MHKLGMFDILSKCFLESFHLQEEKTRHFYKPLESGSHFVFLAKSAITYLCLSALTYSKYFPMTADFKRALMTGV